VCTKFSWMTFASLQMQLNPPWRLETQNRAKAMDQLFEHEIICEQGLM
jgi:hypothetical protein